MFFEVVGRQAQVFEPIHEFRAEHGTFAVKGVAAHPSGFTARQREGADVVKLFAQFTFVDLIGQADRFGPVDQRKRDLGVGFVAKHRLAHQQFIEIRVDEGADDRVDLPFVVPDAGCDVDHE